MSLICVWMKIDLHVKDEPLDWLLKKEALGNSEMAYSRCSASRMF